MEKFRFLNWNVYKDARELCSLILKIVKRLPSEYRFELGSQIIRSSFSIILNIAEGSGKTSNTELNKFINIAISSLNETLAGLDVLRYNKFISEDEFKNFHSRLISISSQLGGFKKKLVVHHKVNL